MSQQIAKTRDTLNKYLTKNLSQIANALPKHLTPERMARIALTEFSKNKALQECTPESIFGSIVIAAQLGLEPGIMGAGYLVPYKGICTFIPGWQGYVDLVSRAGRATVWTGAVFDGDEFDWQLGDQPFCRHKPSGDEQTIDKLTHVYAIGKVIGSETPIIDVWSIKKVIAHRDKNNKVGRSHYSFNHLEMYARKCPLMQVLKYMPKSVELVRAQEVDLNSTEGRGASYIDGQCVTIEPENEPVIPEAAMPETGECITEKQIGLIKAKLAAHKNKDLGERLLNVFEITAIEQLLKSQIDGVLEWISGE